MKIKIFLLACFFSAMLLSCKVSVVPSRSPDAISKVVQASLASDALYDTMIGATDKSYATYKANYASLESQVQAILVADSLRSKPKIILIMAGDIQTRLVQYDAAHNLSGVLNAAQLRTYKDYLHALWESLYNAESNFK